MRRLPWLLTVFTAAAFCLLVGLGVWQVRRLAWKEGLIAQAQVAAAARPAPLDEVLGARDPEFRRALVVCQGLATAPFVELQSIVAGQAGSRLISLCTPPGRGQAFLIDRGFLADTISARPRVQPSTLPLSVLVELRRTPQPGALSPPSSQGRFYARDSAAMAQALGAAAPSEFTLFALASSNPELGGLVASAPPAAFANNHLGYAITWFGLAAALVGVYVALLRRKLAGPHATAGYALGDRPTRTSR